VPSIKLAALGRFLASGGVGLYSNKNFVDVNVDKGKLGSWVG
jgi:uncharacterized protein YcbK (DUF882 family)